MKKVLSTLLNKFGYVVKNKNKSKMISLQFLSKFEAVDYNEILYNSLPYIKLLDKNFEDLRITNDNNGFLVYLKKIKIYVESPEEFYIINEIFLENDYNFFTSHKAIVIDIGANIGLASLFFSTLDCVENIYAFEPVKDTFNQAKYNLQLNESFHKIEEIYNFGLGNSDETKLFCFDKYNKGKTGIRESNEGKIANKVVEIKKSSPIIESILVKHPDKYIVVKIDCEGAEYDILEDFSQNNVIDKIDILMIEWHDKGSDPIEKILKSSGFNIFSRNLSQVSGMIYAYNNRKN